MKQEKIRRVHGYASSGRIGFDRPAQALIECPFNSSVHGRAKACDITIGDITLGKNTKFGVMVADKGAGLSNIRERLMGEVFNDRVDDKNVPLPENGRINNHVGMSAFASHISARDVMVLSREKGKKEVKKYRPGQESCGPFPASKDEKKLFKKCCGGHGFLLYLTDIVGMPHEELRKIANDPEQRKYIGLHIGRRLRNFESKKTEMVLKINGLEIHPIDNLAREEAGRHISIPNVAKIVISRNRIAEVPLDKEEGKTYLDFCRVIHRLRKDIVLPYEAGVRIPSVVTITDVPHADLDPSFREKYYHFAGGTKGTVVSTEFDGRVVDFKTLLEMFKESKGGHDLSTRVEISIDPIQADGRIVRDIKRSKSYYTSQCLEVLQNDNDIKEAIKEIRDRRKKALKFIDLLKRKALDIEEKRLKEEVAPSDEGHGRRAASSIDAFKEPMKAEGNAYSMYLSTLENSKNIRNAIKSLSEVREKAFSEALKKCSPFSKKRAIGLFKNVHAECLRDHASLALNNMKKEETK